MSSTCFSTLRTQSLVFVLLLRLTNKIWPAAFIAALFGWHPVHVESVAWISERKDVLSTFFALLALLSYAWHVTGDKWQVTGKESAPAAIVSPVTCHLSPFYWLSLVFFTLGLLAKPMLVTLPFVMLLLDFWPLQRVTNDKWRVTSVLQLVKEKIPFFALAAISCAVTFLAQQHGDAVVSLTKVSMNYRLENAVPSRSSGIC